jgi:hypothetical protein
VRLDLAESLRRLRRGVAGGGGGDEGAASGARLDHPRLLELPVGAGDRVDVDDEVRRQLANGREAVARLQQAGRDRVPDLVDELGVDRLPRAGDELEGSDRGSCVACTSISSTTRASRRRRATVPPGGARHCPDGEIARKARMRPVPMMKPSARLFRSTRNGYSVERLRSSNPGDGVSTTSS